MDKKGRQIKKVKRKKMSIENQSIFNTITEICDVLMLDRKFHGTHVPFILPLLYYKLLFHKMYLI
jgi:hypothetical protein